MKNRLEKLSEHLYRLVDICNVYLVLDGDRGLLIDSGSGRVLESLDQLGGIRIENVLHTHHHRDQCMGTARVREQGARVVVPEYERHLFERAELFWQSRRIFDNYDDRNTFFSIGEDLPVDAVLEDYEVFNWRGYEFFVLPAKGHTFGSVALLCEIDGRRVAFTGDLMKAGGRLYQLHAMEYTYAAMEGVVFTLQSLRALRKHNVDVCFPSHGDPIEQVTEDINRLENRLMKCVNLGRGMRVCGRVSAPESLFLPDSPLLPISRHLLWGGSWTCSNFYVLLSESRKAMLIDYGHAYWPHLHIGADHDGWETARFVEHHLDELEETHSVEEIDVVVATHIHDDHTCGIPYLQRHHGTRCWALEQVAQVLEQPAAWSSTPCVFPKPIRIDRRLEDGQKFRWEEYELEIYFAPGQTEFHSVISVAVDGRKVAFTGDNYFIEEVVEAGSTRLRPFQTTVLRNSFQLAMHRRCAEVMRRISPELICPGHRDVLPCTKADIDDYCDFIERKEEVFRQLVGEPADHYIDLFWARMLPYQSRVEPGEELPVRLLLRNNFGKPVQYEARLLAPPGWRVSLEFSTLVLEAGSRGEIELRAVAPGQVDERRRLMTAEIKIDGESQGPLVEALVQVSRPRAGSGPAQVDGARLTDRRR